MNQQAIDSEADDDLMPEYDFSQGVRGKHYQDYRERFVMGRQERRYHLSLSGEFFVAAELQRRGVSASVTYGNAKRADVVVFSELSSNIVVAEVKSTSGNRWVIGPIVPARSEKPWVFVHIPENPDETPNFYILTQSELTDILAPLDQEFRRRYLKKHGVEFQGRGVVGLSFAQAEPHKNAWWKILRQVLEHGQTKQAAQRRRPPPQFLGKVKELGDVITSVPPSDWGVE
jgi:hypothetical protein